MSKNVKQYLEHFSKTVSKEIYDYTTDVVFKNSRYIFTEKIGAKQYGYCTHCNSTFQTGGLVQPDPRLIIGNLEALKHNKKAICPSCGSECTVKASGRGRKQLIDRAYFVFYEKSVIDTNVIVARGIEAYRDYRGSYKKVQTMFHDTNYYVFEAGKGGVMLRPMSYFNPKWNKWEQNLQTTKTVYSGFDKIGSYKTWMGYSRDSIKAAVKDTPFRWSTWEQYDHDDMTVFFDLFSKYPAVEYLTKLGFKNIVQSKLNGDHTYNTVNWRGKTLLKVLKLSKAELNEVKNKSIKVTFWFLNLLKFNRKESWGLTLEELSKMATVFDDFYDLDKLNKMVEYASVRQILSYMEKQLNKYAAKHYHSMTYVFSNWFDYIEDCRKLDFDLSKENVIFPKDVHAAHQNTIVQVKIKANEHLNKAIAERIQELRKKYFFEYRGLFIRPAESATELVNEGKDLNHCVGTYAERHAKGEISIFFIRKATKPKKPYYTLELRQDRIIQTRGKNNSNPNPDVEEFIKAFTEEKLTKKKDRVKITVPA